MRNRDTHNRGTVKGRWKREESRYEREEGKGEERMQNQTRQ